MAADPQHLTAEAREFMTERHLASLTTLRRSGAPHVVPVGFTWDDAAGLARVITRRGSQKARNADRGGPGVLCQVERGRWITLEGTLVLITDPESVADAEHRYAARYRTPRPNPERVVIALRVQRVLGSPAFLGEPARVH